MELVGVKKQLDSLMYSYKLMLEKNAGLIGSNVRTQIETKYKNLEDAIDSPSIPIPEIESLLEEFRNQVVNLGAQTYEAIQDDSNKSTDYEMQNSGTVFETVDDDDEFKSIENEILSGLSQISEDLVTTDSEKDDTITGDYETVD